MALGRQDSPSGSMESTLTPSVPVSAEVTTAAASGTADRESEDTPLTEVSSSLEPSTVTGPVVPSQTHPESTPSPAVPKPRPPETKPGPTLPPETKPSPAVPPASTHKPTQPVIPPPPPPSPPYAPPAVPETSGKTEWEIWSETEECKQALARVEEAGNQAGAAKLVYEEWLEQPYARKYKELSDKADASYRVYVEKHAATVTAQEQLQALQAQNPPDEAAIA